MKNMDWNYHGIYGSSSFLLYRKSLYSKSKQACQDAQLAEKKFILSMIM